MDLGGYVGDFHRHRVNKSEIKKRLPLNESELINMMTEIDRLKEIGFAIRDIDPDRNGFVTQQELDDIFRENYRDKMQGKHIFGLIKDFRSVSNKILVDYVKFKKWVNMKLLNRRKSMKEAKSRQDDPRRAVL